MQLNADELRARLEPLFQENFEKFGELGAAVSVCPAAGAPLRSGE